MLRLSKNDHRILHAALVAAIDDDSELWLKLSTDDVDRAEEICEALSIELEDADEEDEEEDADEEDEEYEEDE